MNILARVEDHVRRNGDKIFSIVRGEGACEAITYSGLWRGAEAYRRLFAERGVRRGSLVLIMVRDARSVYFAFVGAMLHGAIPSIMPYCTAKQDPDRFWASHTRLFARIRPSAIVTFRAYAVLAAQASAGSAALVFDDEAQADAAYTEPTSLPDSEIAFLQHSSGTTGLKKGVMLSHGAVNAQIEAYAPAIGLTAESVVASWLPLYHDMGLIACFITPMLCGATIVQLDPIEWVAAPLTLLDAIEAHKATHAWLPNFAFHHLALHRRSARKWDLSSLHALIDCSEPCKLKSLRLFAEKFADCGLASTVPQVCYAMAETVFAITQTPLGDPVTGLSVSRSRLAAEGVAVESDDGADIQVVTSCGVPLAGLSVRIVDDAGAPLEDGRVGEIVVTGASLYAGYNEMPELTAQKLKNGWHHTGDLGFLRAGHLYVTGRKDDLLIVRGRNYYAHEVEDVMSRMDGVQPGRVIAFAAEQEASGTSEVVCLAETRGAVDAAVLRGRMRTHIETEVGVTVGRVVFVAPGSLVKTTSGKISREANRSKFLEGAFRSE